MARTPGNLARHELIGLQVAVVKAADPGLVGLKGQVVDETMKTLVIESGGKERRVPKAGCAFLFELDGQNVGLDGSDIAYRPEERTKKAR